MKKYLLIASIFTVLVSNTAKAERYYEEDGYYYQETPRYVRRVEYVEDRGYKREQPRYKRISQSEARQARESKYRQNTYREYEDPNKVRPYIGIDVASSKIKFGDDEWIKDYEGGDNYFDDGNTSVSFVVGAKFNKHFGLEAFYQKSGDGESEVEYDDIDYYGEDKTSINYTAMGIDAIGYFPVNQEVEILASLGLAQYDFESKVSYVEYSYGDSYEGEESKDFDSLGIRLGIGAQYNITDHVSLRAMARYAKMNDDEYIKSLMELSLGLRYMF